MNIVPEHTAALEHRHQPRTKLKESQQERGLR